jgi:hypothetical protein
MAGRSARTIKKSVLAGSEFWRIVPSKPLPPIGRNGFEGKIEGIDAWLGSHSE